MILSSIFLLWLYVDNKVCGADKYANTTLLYSKFWTSTEMCQPLSLSVHSTTPGSAAKSCSSWMSNSWEMDICSMSLVLMPKATT